MLVTEAAGAFLSAGHGPLWSLLRGESEDQIQDPLVTPDVRAREHAMQASVFVEVTAARRAMEDHVDRKLKKLQTDHRREFSEIVLRQDEIRRTLQEMKQMQHALQAFGETDRRGGGLRDVIL